MAEGIGPEAHTNVTPKRLRAISREPPRPLAEVEKVESCVASLFLLALAAQTSRSARLSRQAMGAKFTKFTIPWRKINVAFSRDALRTLPRIRRDEIHAHAYFLHKHVGRACLDHH